MKNCALERLALDRASKRHVDENGFLHVSGSAISKEGVNPYYGREVPGWREAGLDPERVYHGYRPGRELAEGATTFCGLPLLLDHHVDSAENPQKEHRVGSLGTDVSFRPPYLLSSLVVTDEAAIRAIETGRARELSAAYMYEPVFQPGVFAGKAYDFVMTRLRGNHVALVEEGRAGPDVVVADARPTFNPQVRRTDMGLINCIKSLIAAARAEGIEPDRAGADQFPDLPSGGQPERLVADKDDHDLTAFYDLIEAVPDAELAEALREQAADMVMPAEEREWADMLREAMRACGFEPGQEDFGEFLALLTRAAQEMRSAEMSGDMEPDETLPEGEGLMEEADFPEAGRHVSQDRRIKRRGQASRWQRDEAARLVRPLSGRIDPLAFDSAAAIYRYALNLNGRRPRTRDPEALRDMVEMCIANLPVRPAHLAAPEQFDGPFKNLSRIRIA